MKTYQRRLMDMFERVDQFGKKPELTLTAIITTLLAVVTGRLAAMRAWMAAQTNGKGGMREGAAVKRVLFRELLGMLKDVREIAVGLEISGTLGLSELFRLPRPQTYANTLATARSFVLNITPMIAAFTARGLSATFIADLEAKITAFDAATGDKNDGKANWTGSTAALRASGAAGLKAVQELRTIMRVHLRSSPDLLAAWKNAARVERSARTAPTGGPGPEPTPPPSGS